MANTHKSQHVAHSHDLESHLDHRISVPFYSMSVFSPLKHLRRRLRLDPRYRDDNVPPPTPPTFDRPPVTVTPVAMRVGQGDGEV